MPLLDHFRPPLSVRRHWESFHSSWASAIAGEINTAGLPDYFFAEPTVNLGGQAQVDVATFDDIGSHTSPNNGHGGVATMPAIAAPTWVIPALYPDWFEVKVFSQEAGPTLVAAIELVSPANKDRPDTRNAFAMKCANYLHQNVSVIVIDIVTIRNSNMHNEILDAMQSDGARMPEDALLYANAYRPARRKKRDEIEIWAETLNLGGRLPVLPLFLAADLAMNIDFELSYGKTCELLRL